eukprot:GHUV01017293.1.p1 GENE.GHUV01017293.1~~GHUV01017293.1.p1  ORF type:complete len:122 (+),score=19.04 GHUV01017293.1:157-522(+)
MALSCLSKKPFSVGTEQKAQAHKCVCSRLQCHASASGTPESSHQPDSKQPQHACKQLINPGRRQVMLVVPMVAAAVATVGSAGPAQAAEPMDLENKCLECAGIGIVPCEITISLATTNKCT